MMATREKKRPGTGGVRPVFEGIGLVRSGDLGYPSNLTQLPEFPETLWYRGTLEEYDHRAVAVVGSRACSEPGMKRAYRLARDLAEVGVCVVSGLARGVDGAAHRGALAGGGRTLAVLGTGLNRVYPYEHRDLSEEISRCGAVLSQFLPDYTGSRHGWNFRKRNGLVVGLSQIVIVVEAKARSGTADTIRKALSCGRRVGLLRSLVESEGWAAELAEHHQVFTVRSVECVIERLEA